jgi:hypothetical protein
MGYQPRQQPPGSWLPLAVMVAIGLALAAGFLAFVWLCTIVAAGTPGM